MTTGRPIISRDSKLSLQLRWLTPQLTPARESIRWACLLEATAPKAGNVFPGNGFSDLSYVDFVRAADITAEVLDTHERFGYAVAKAAERIRALMETNVNLGILLLLGPLFRADQILSDKKILEPTQDDWLTSVADALRELESGDESAIFHAISISAAGGLGKVKKWDVHEATGQVNLMDAMRDAAMRDRVAKQYAFGFSDLMESVVPVLMESIVQTGDLLAGIVNAQIKLLTNHPDTLISRKSGECKAEEVRELASEVDPNQVSQRVKLDQFLRRDGNRFNPGTTADLIAAGLFVIFRSLPEARGDSAF